MTEAETNTQPVAGGQGYIITGDPGDKATGILSGGGEIVLATIPTGATQAAFYAPPNVSHVRLDAADAARASLMSFNGAPGGFAASGGGSTPAPAVIPGQKIVTENPPDKILRHGEIYHFPFTDNPINCAFSDCAFDDAAGRVITFEIWVDTGYCAPPVDFNADWQRVGVIPMMSDSYTSYRFTARKAPGLPPELNYAYCVPIPQPA